MIGNLLPFPYSSNLRKGQKWRCLYLTLKRWGLRGLLSTRYEAVDGYSLPGHHFFTGKKVSGWQVDYKLLGFHYRSLRFNGVLRVKHRDTHSADSSRRGASSSKLV